ncbi:hypothetical protein [Sinorhizobium americanum]|uniref:Secreted protein n=1 Tax=Sinorhizobium americanum TaxID=194963 RepID=A0A4R2BW81_9HYPH|nr:hypothetical protein [Sinorhizobium americanum]TCN30294.1 hypothetical protein EV184_108168 [Sinorhizobium americanum]
MTGATLALSRRAFLSGVAAVAIVPALPSIAAPAAAPAAVAAAEVLPTFVCGTPDAFNWRPYAARTAEEAIGQWLDEQGLYDPEERADADVQAERVSQWDGRSEADIKAADWIKAGLGHCCSRCGGETCADDGAEAVGDEAVCDYCLTFADWVHIGDDAALDELADLIADQGEDEARAALINRGDWEVIPDDLWQRAIRTAEELA